MKKFFVLAVAAMVLGIFTVSTAMATSGFYAISNQLGYGTSISNTTDGTGPWFTDPATTPRDAYLYTIVNVPGNPDYNILMSNWSEHAPSNTNNAFFQLYDVGNASVTSASGGWDASLTTFSMQVVGANAPYPWSRAWQPDNGVAWGVTFTDYSYSLTATFASAAIPESGGYMNNGAPSSIEGTFLGHFIVTDDPAKNPITNGDTYTFIIPFGLSIASPLTSGEFYNSFGTTGPAAVPEPATMLLFGCGLVGLAGFRRKFRQS